MTVLFPNRDFDESQGGGVRAARSDLSRGAAGDALSAEPSYEGKTLAEIAKLRGTDAAQTMMDMIKEAGEGTSAS